MLFSDFYNINVDGSEYWFDPILNLDTKLFIDPILLKEVEAISLKGSYNRILEFFEHAFRIAAESDESPTDMRYRLLKNQLVFPEVQELCLGYSNETIDGAGSGRGFAQKIIDSIYLSIKLGMYDPSNFEKISIFNKGIAEDRISDISGNIIKELFIEYTQQICSDLGIPMSKFHIKHVSYDLENRRWINKQVHLPKNPFFKDKAVILIPKSILGLAPSINPKDFIDYCYEHKGRELRDEFSFAIQASLKKDEIIEIARKRTDWVKEYESYKSTQKIQGYDIVNDPMQLYNPIKAVIKYLRENPLKHPVKNKEDITDLVEMSIRNCLTFLDLYSDSVHYFLRDHSLKSVLKLAIGTYMHDNKIEIDNSNNIGNKPVTFSLTNAVKKTFDFKIKSAKNTRFWNMLRKSNVVEEDAYIIIADSLNVDYKKAIIIENIIQSLDIVNNSTTKYIFDSFVNFKGDADFRTVSLRKRIDKDKVKKLILKNQLDEALDVLENQYIHKELTNIRAQLNKSKADYLKGVKSLENHDIDVNRIRSVILEILE